MLFAPLEGWRHVEVTDHHTAVNYAQILRDLSDKYFPSAAKIVLVQDNLNIHAPTSLYQAFPPAEARRLTERGVHNGEEVGRLLECAPGPKYRATLGTAYGAGFAGFRGSALKISDIDSTRMLIRVEQGGGAGG